MAGRATTIEIYLHKSQCKIKVTLQSQKAPKFKIGQSEDILKVVHKVSIQFHVQTVNFWLPAWHTYFASYAKYVTILGHF